MNRALFALFRRFFGQQAPVFTGLLAAYGLKRTVQTQASDGVTDPTLGTVINVDNAAGNRALLLPVGAAALVGMKLTYVRVTATANTCTVGRSGSDTIDGGTSAKSLSAQWKAFTLVLTAANSWVTESAT